MYAVVYPEALSREATVVRSSSISALESPPSTPDFSVERQL